MSLIKLGLATTSTVVSTTTERRYLYATTIPDLLLLSVLAFPAAYRLHCRRDGTSTACCGCQRAGARGYAAANLADEESAAIRGQSDGAAQSASAAPADDDTPSNTKLPGFLTSGLWSRAMFTWLSPLMKVGYKRALEQSDICKLAPADRACVVSHKFNANWSKQVRVIDGQRPWLAY